MEKFRSAAAMGFLILLAGLYTPWMFTFAASSEHQATLLTIYMHGLNGPRSNTLSVLIPLTLYPVATILALIGVLSRKITLAAGVCAVSTGLLWVVGNAWIYLLPRTLGGGANFLGPGVAGLAGVILLGGGISGTRYTRFLSIARLFRLGKFGTGSRRVARYLSSRSVPNRISIDYYSQSL